MFAYWKQEDEALKYCGSTCSFEISEHKRVHYSKEMFSLVSLCVLRLATYKSANFSFKVQEKDLSMYVVLSAKKDC